MSKIDRFIFVGPTSFDMDLKIFSDFNILPPVRRGDITDLVVKNSPGTIVIVDGTFHSFPSVGHAEIRDAIEKDWKIWGLSSMGAIRAAEMDSLGMFGFGKVYRQYRMDENFSDDEVTLVHSLEYPYEAVSIPLINIRSLLNYLCEHKLIESSRSEIVINKLKYMWYANRRWKILLSLLKDQGCNINYQKLCRILKSTDKKRNDLTDFLSKKPYLGAT